MTQRTKGAIRRMLGEIEKRVDKEWIGIEEDVRSWDRVCLRKSNNKYGRYMSKVEADRAGFGEEFAHFKKAAAKIDAAYKIITYIEEIDNLLNKFDNN